MAIIAPAAHPDNVEQDHVVAIKKEYIMKKNTFYVTTPIYYVNDIPHVGNAYTTIIADIVTRYHKLKSDNTFFLTGTDENATKVANAAADKGIDPQVYVDQLAEEFKVVWKSLDIKYDDFIRTTEPRHKEVVEAIFMRLLEQGDIYKGKYEGWYCVPCESFYNETDLVDGKCPDCARAVEWIEEENYYFKLTKYSDKLLQHIQDNPGFLMPEFRKNEVVSFINQGLRDISITRDNKGWGIPVPGDPSKVLYVWFDALINYISAAGYISDPDRFASVWPADLQLMGKDIFVRFHCTFWPAILMALDLGLPGTMFGHGFWTTNGEKISKSKGNAISPAKLANDLAADSGADPSICIDAIRYFVAREVAFGMDGDFSIESFRNRFNGDLANDLGNLLNRTLSMLNKYFDGVITEPADFSGELSGQIEESFNAAQKALDKLEFVRALESIWQMIGAGNKYVNDRKPWDLEKSGDTVELAGVLYSAMEVARAAAIMLSPFMPSVAKEIARQLGIADDFDSLRWQDAIKLKSLPIGTKVLGPVPIFPRIQKNKKEEPKKVDCQADTEIKQEIKPETIAAEVEEVKEAVETISYDYFSKLKFCVAEVLSAEKVEKADKLLKLQVSLGDEERQIVAGIAQYYTPEEIVGKKVVLLTNLEPAKIRGVVSNGMLLAADLDGKAVVLMPEIDVPAGSKIK